MPIPNENKDDLRASAAIGEADKVAARQLTQSLKTPFRYFDKDNVRKKGGAKMLAKIRRLWEPVEE